MFPAADPKKVVLAMDVHPLIPTGQGTNTYFDPGIMYQFKIAHGPLHYVADEVIQFKATGADAGQKITMYGPADPASVGGAVSSFVAPSGSITYNHPDALANGAMLFAGPRQDPFYFDLEQFLKIIPDRDFKAQPNPGPASAKCFRTPGVDFLEPFNVLTLAVEIPRALLADKSGKLGIIHVWATTSIDSAGSGAYQQIERLGRPAVKEATERFRDHNITNHSTPTNDQVLARSIYTFARTTAHRSDATAKALAKLLIPDELMVNLASDGPARYLGVETNGKSGLPVGIVRLVPNGGITAIKKGLTNPVREFGGRDPSSPVMDLSLGALFGSLPGKLGLAAEDKQETECLTSDHVQPPDRGVTKTFPYFGPPV